MYYYINRENKPEGPVPANELSRHGVTLDTFVWRKGMKEWVRVRDLSNLKPIVERKYTPTVGVQQPERIDDFMPKDEGSSLLKWGLGIAIGIVVIITLIIVILLVNKQDGRTYGQDVVDTLAVDSVMTDSWEQMYEIPKRTTTEIIKK